jgi:hypothetical protein
MLTLSTDRLCLSDVEDFEAKETGEGGRVDIFWYSFLGYLEIADVKLSLGPVLIDD